MGRDGYVVPADPQAVVVAKKKTQSSRSWILLDCSGQSTVLDVDKYAIMHRVQIHARDLRILDPLLSYPSTILGRERAIVLNLEHIKAIITSEEVLLRDPSDENVIPVVAELQRRLPPVNVIREAQGDGKEDAGGHNEIEAGEEDESPFEFRALEVALEAICNFLAARTTELETAAYPALDELTSKNVDGVNYFHVKVVGLLFVATTRVNVSPSLVLELLQRIARVIKDYLGVLNEDSLRKNFVLVYELLDEVIDFGYVQTTSTEVLKSYVFNEPIVIDAARLQPLGPAAIFMQGTKRMPGTAVTKSVVANEPGGRKREEIFVDIIEKISVTFSSSGYILTSEIDGTIQMKSYLTGNPEIRLALNEDLSIGKDGRSVYDYRSSSGSGAVILDDCNFHESVRLDNFDLDRTLSLVPPDGEFPVMNYRMTQEFKPPFRINTLIEEAGTLKAEVIIKISAEFPSNITANTIVVEMPLPKYTTRVSFGLEPGAVGQRTDFKEANKRLEWGLKKIVGGSEHMLRAKLTFSQESHGNITKESGPVSMTFTIPMYNASKLQVKYLQIAKKSSTYNPYRWVRYVTQANSYVARI